MAPFALREGHKRAWLKGQSIFPTPLAKTAIQRWLQVVGWHEGVVGCFGHGRGSAAYEVGEKELENIMGWSEIKM